MYSDQSLLLSSRLKSEVMLELSIKRWGMDSRLSRDVKSSFRVLK